VNLIKTCLRSHFTPKSKGKKQKKHLFFSSIFLKFKHGVCEIHPSRDRIFFLEKDSVGAKGIMEIRFEKEQPKLQQENESALKKKEI